MKLPKYQSTFFLGAVEELINDRVDLHFSRTKYIDDCSGYFSENPLSLKVAIWRKEWFSVFLHEYNHYKQWKKQTDAWVNAIDTDFLNTFKPEDRLKTQLMEQECDIASYLEIKTYNLEGMENYVREANAYHVSYKNMEEHKSWFKKDRLPYNIDEVTKLCPNDRFFTRKELDNPDPRIYDAISKQCF